ncbi:DUF6377 domain-containing protein [Mariniflexile maritimum]|uniref:DUF6377 domain-containing protein n=1 Tax=Mariniflexile maritimum TaxID=2682493 RepID=UPI0012F67463|nr:DUF6377 domain-containing protein [Mariniflexile maritimum]
MSKHFILIVFMLSLKGFSFQKDTILQQLESTINKREVFVKKKYAAIEKIKKEATKHVWNGDQSKLYEDYLLLFKEYQSFRYDSAYYYIEQAKLVARAINDPVMISTIKIKEGFVLMSSGLFNQAIDTLNSINFETLTDVYKFEYYSVKARTYYDWADYIGDNRFSADYIEKGSDFLLKALFYVKPATNEYWSTEGLRRLKSQDWGGAKEAFETWIANFNLPTENYAIATSSLAHVYSMLGDNEKNIHYLTLAAIADIQSATKETVALRNLASELFKVGDLKKAYKYIGIAMEDATFYNARHRKVELSSILPIIENAQIKKTQGQNVTLSAIIVILSILAILVVVFLFIIFKQLKALKKSRRILAHSNHKLKKLNTNLREADRIKQEYIAYFLKVSSDFIHKIDQIQKSTYQKIMAKRPEEVFSVLKKYSVKKARIHLFQQFDEVFLKLFPSFLDDYYNLFPEIERVHVKTDTSLNNELRIFALYRLGVQDSRQVADFLELSVATVYSYKTRIKNKSNFKENFEQKIMEIKQFEVNE